MLVQVRFSAVSTTDSNAFLFLLLMCPAAILDDQTVCGRGERLALALAREHINSIIEVPAKARVEVEIFELQRDSQYETTDTSTLRVLACVCVSMWQLD